MHTPFTRAVLLAIPAAIACGGSSPPSQPDPPVLTTVDLIPDTATLFTVPPGTSVKLAAVGRDQDGVALSGAGPAQFSSAADGVATTGSDGTVSAVSPGTAVITATMSAGEITRSGTATVTVRVPPLAAAVQAPSRRFEPVVVDIAAGGVVTWTIGDIPHDVVFTTPNAPENVQPTSNAAVSREFPTSGDFAYHCLIHSGMNGTVRVH